MITSGLVNVIVDKCDIYYGKALVSKESIIKKYATFFATALSSETRNVSFSLHTGSMCFDMVSIVAVALGCISFNLTSNDDILASLKMGDMVLFKNGRYRWNGTTELFGEKYIVLEQDGRGKNGKQLLKIPYEMNKHLVKPYYGTSELTDSRGVRRATSDREEFLSWIFGVPVSEVPSLIEVSVVIVAERSEFAEIAKHLNIVYGDHKRINLLDIVPAAYYTISGQEYQLGKNPTKSEPVLKVAGEISAARELALDKHGNKVVGLLVTGVKSLSKNGSELADLLERKSLSFVHVTGSFKADVSEYILELYGSAPLFACTREYLSHSSTEIQNKNTLTTELNRQIYNIVNSHLSIVSVPNGWGWNEYKKIREELMLIKQSNWENEKKNDFIISAHSLLNLFNTAIFSMAVLEDAITHNKINASVISPLSRIEELWQVAEIAGSMKYQCTTVVDALETRYNALLNESPKYLMLKQCLTEYFGKRIVIIVPKAYYINILMLEDIVQGEEENVSFITANRFDATRNYDVILVFGDVRGTKFDPIQCRSAKDIEIFLYENESKLFNYRKKKADRLEKRLDAKIGVISVEEQDLPDRSLANNVYDIDDEEERTVQEFSDFDQYIDSLSAFDIRKLVTGITNTADNSPVSEVRIIGAFTDGEQIFFSKYYNAIVFAPEEGKVVETPVDKLMPGDILVFIRRDDYTRNMVDFIYDQLLQTNRLNDVIVNATEKALYWKEALKEHKTNGNYTYRDIAKKLKKFGSSLREMTIRQWLTEDSHIVGPRDEKTMEQIAMLTQDPYLLKNTNGYFEACRIVRHQRKKILNLIGKAISDKLGGNMPQQGSILKIVYNNVENLSETLELENISSLEQSVDVPIGLVNRPINETEVLM